jgi:hypothetical protein
MKAPSQFKQLLPRHAEGIRQSRARIREDIESIRETVRATGRTLRDARASIERADAVLARDSGPGQTSLAAYPGGRQLRGNED